MNKGKQLNWKKLIPSEKDIEFEKYMQSLRRQLIKALFKFKGGQHEDSSRK